VALQPDEQLFDARFQREAFTRDDAVVRGMPASQQRIGGILGAVVRADHGGAIDEVAPDHRLRQRHVEIDAQRRRRIAPRARGKRLGIEHEPVHVEDHRRGSADGPR